MRFLTVCWMIIDVKLLQQARDKEEELFQLLKITPVEIWNTDLDKFLDAYGVCRPSLNIRLFDVDRAL